MSVTSAMNVDNDDKQPAPAAADVNHQHQSAARKPKDWKQPELKRSPDHANLIVATQQASIFSALPTVESKNKIVVSIEMKGLADRLAFQQKNKRFETAFNHIPKDSIVRKQ